LFGFARIDYTSGIASSPPPATLEVMLCTSISSYPHVLYLRHLSRHVLTATWRRLHCTAWLHYFDTPIITYRPYDYGKLKHMRMKPKAMKLEVDVPVDPKVGQHAP
jgi:hypothetical protein